MQLFNLQRRRAVFLLLFFLGACQSQNSWEASHLQTGNKAYDSSRLSYRIRDIVNEIGVEIIYSQGEVSGYLVVHAQTIPPYHEDPKQALVTMKIDGKTFQEIAYRHAGGQRLSLPPSLQEILITSLQQKSSVTIVLEGYSTTVEPGNFSLDSLKAPLFKNRFQLPFKVNL